MRVLFASTRGAGHFNPLVPFIEAALDAGHEVLVAGPPSLAEHVERAGYPFLQGDEPTEAEREAVWASVPDPSLDRANQIMVGEIFGRLNTAALLPELRAVLDDWRPDLVIREQVEFSSAIAADERGIPHACVCISLSALARRWLTFAGPAIEEHRPGIAERIWRAPHMTLFPASLDNPDAEPPPDLRRFRDRAEPAGEQPLADWWGDDSLPLVYASFGSHAGATDDAPELFGRVLEAAAELPVRLLLTVGREFDVERLPPAPPNVHVEAWVPQADVFGHASLVLTHGGSGTTLGALAAGLPLVVVPLFADQPDNARRVAAVGAGVVTEPPGMREAIETVLGEARYTRAAQRLAQEIAWLPPADEAIAELAPPA